MLCSRGCSTPREAADLLSVDGPLPPPEAMTDLPAAAQRVRQALENGERIAVFGDYDVDGITSTCLLTQFLREQGGDCLFYIPGRMEEGYGLNIPAIDALHQQGVTLLITVDCGITAHREAAYCRELGLDLIITDHHECKDALPDAVAVVDPTAAMNTTPTVIWPVWAWPSNWPPPSPETRKRSWTGTPIWCAWALWPTSCP